MTLLEFRKRVRYALYLAARGERAAADAVNDELRAYVDSAIDTVIHTHRKSPSHSFAYFYYCEGMEQSGLSPLSHPTIRSTRQTFAHEAAAMFPSRNRRSETRNFL